MRSLMRWGGVLLGVVVLFGVGAAAVVYGLSERRVRRVYDVQPPAVSVPADDSALIREGGRLANVYGCVDCHGPNLGGGIVIDDPAIGTLAAPNLTSGSNGVAPSYTDQDWARAIRHGIRADGTPLMIMPSKEFFHLSDDDLRAILAFVKSVPPVTTNLPRKRLGPLGRFLFVAGQLPLLAAEDIDHSAPRPDAPTPARTADYGEYLAVACTGCHGDGFSGGPVPGMPPDAPPSANLTPNPDDGIGAWSEQDFFTAIRQGRRPDGSQILADFMPWPYLSAMTDDEIHAVWLYLRSLPARRAGGR